MLIYTLILINLISITISIPQINIIESLLKNLSIRNCVIIKNQIKEGNIDISLTKYLSKYNLQAVIMSVDDVNETFYQYYFLKIHKPRVLAILDLKIDFDSLTKIFSSDNEPFLKNYIWAIFDVDMSVIENLEGFYIPYNCRFLNIKRKYDGFYEIFEVYHMKVFKRNIYEKYYGVWEEGKGIRQINYDFYGRRFDMNYTLFPVVEDYYSELKNHPAIRAYKEIITDMAKMMNFRPFFISYRKFIELWNSGTGDYYEIDVGLFVLHSSAYYVDVIAPIWKASAFLHIAYNKKYEQGYSSPHTRPLNKNLWLTIVFWILISGLCIILINYTLQKKSIENTSSWINQFFIPFDSFTNQCGYELPKMISARIAIIMTRLAPLLIINVYSAAVLSFVTVKLIDLPFQDLRGLVQDGSFKIGFENGTFTRSFFRESNDPVTQIASKKFTVGLDEMPTSATEGIEKMCKDPKFVFLFFNNDIFGIERECEILQIPAPIFVTWDAISLRDFSPYTRIFNRILKTFQSAGILHKMEKIVYGEKPVLKKDEDIDPVRLESVAPLLQFISFLYFVPLLILILECIYKIKDCSKFQQCQ